MKKLLLVLPFLVLISCGVQKRKYQSGYHFSWLKSKSQPEKKHELAGNKRSPFKTKTKTEPVLDKVLDLPGEEEVFASTKKEFAQATTPSKKQLIKADPCDELVFNDGTELKVKITEINDTEVRYKKCDMPDGPVYVVNKSKLFMVRYANGTKEVFRNSQDQTNNSSSQKSKYNGPKRFHPLAIFALIFGILSFFPLVPVVFSILAISFGKSALQKINNEPQLYKGADMAKTGRILGIITLVLWLLALIFVLGIIFGILLLSL